MKFSGIDFSVWPVENTYLLRTNIKMRIRCIKCVTNDLAFWMDSKKSESQAKYITTMSFIPKTAYKLQNWFNPMRLAKRIFYTVITIQNCIHLWLWNLSWFYPKFAFETDKIAMKATKMRTIVVSTTKLLKTIKSFPSEFLIMLVTS